MSMEIKCRNCGQTSPVNLKTIQRVMGGGLIFTGAYGWITYAFAGLLGFHGGALLIAASLIGIGAFTLHKKDASIVLSVAKRISEFLNDKGYKCKKCGKSDWQLSKIGGNEAISGDQHRHELDKALDEAIKELYIISGFLSSNVVNDGFIARLKAALKRKTHVYLVFSDERSHSNDLMRPKYEKALSKLVTLRKEFPNLHLIQKHTHQKGIIIDDKYAIIGSFNFLSNRNASRKETSIKTYDHKIIEEFKKDVLN